MAISARLDEVFQKLPVGGGDELHAALGNGPARERLLNGGDLVDDDHLRHVVLHSLNHHLVLVLRVRHLHAPGAPDGAVRHVAVAADLIAGIDDHNALVKLVGEDAGLRRDRVRRRGRGG